MNCSRPLVSAAVSACALALTGSALAGTEATTPVSLTVKLAQPQLVARAAPSPAARPLRLLRQFRSDFRPTVLYADQAQTVKGVRWLHVLLAGRPNGQRAWVLASAVTTRQATVEIRVSRSLRLLQVFRAGREVFSTRIAVGATGMETPAGRFFISARFVPLDSFLGSYAFETSAYSKLSDWPGGGVVGIHGTSAPQLLGQAVSHGCMRVGNEAILKLRTFVGLGTPITIS